MDNYLTDIFDRLFIELHEVSLLLHPADTHSPRSPVFKNKPPANVGKVSPAHLLDFNVEKT
jgi:hypothetical protein